MIDWIRPLGFLGLLSILVLILIYLLKPNYQQKIVSSTFVWRLSLKYKKKRLPINRFRNILIFICQVLILTSCAFILVQPVIRADAVEYQNEKIIVLDASASMMAESSSADHETRFERAVDEISDLVYDVLNNQNGLVSIIVANENPSYLVQRSGVADYNDIIDKLEELTEPVASSDETVFRPGGCTFGQVDIDSAISMTENVLLENPDAQIILYTATEYIDKGNVTVELMREEDEWNAAILNVTPVLEDNFFTFVVDVATYGKSTEINLKIEVLQAQTSSSMKVDLDWTDRVNCKDGQVEQRIYDLQFMSDNDFDYKIATYETVRVTIDTEYEADSFSYDNEFLLYGGQKPSLKLYYYSTRRNNFINGILMDVRDSFSDKWNIEYANDPEIGLLNEGYDVYFYEEAVPEELPTDGISFLIYPDRLPEGCGVTLGETVNADGGDSFVCTAGESHPITDSALINPEAMIVNSYKQLIPDDTFTTLMYCGGDPAVVVKNSGNQKLFILSFTMKFTDFSLRVDFPALIYNFFNYFLPPTVESNVYDVNQAVTVNARGPNLTLYDSKSVVLETFETLPASFTMDMPGTYYLAQTPMSGVAVQEAIFIKIPTTESQINKTEDELHAPSISRPPEPIDKDLLLYFAAALVAFLFAEWWLQSRNQF